MFEKELSKLVNTTPLSRGKENMNTPPGLGLGAKSPAENRGVMRAKSQALITASKSKYLIRSRLGVRTHPG